MPAKTLAIRPGSFLLVPFGGHDTGCHEDWGTRFQGSLIYQSWPYWGREGRAGDQVEGPGLPQLVLHLNCPKTSGRSLSLHFHQGLTKEGEKTSYVLTDRLGAGDPRRCVSPCALVDQGYGGGDNSGGGGAEAQNDLGNTPASNTAILKSHFVF